MTQKLRALVELEVPDQVNLDALKESMGDAFPGKVRFPEDEDLVIFFHPNDEDGPVRWGTVPPSEVLRHCTRTGNQMLRPVDPDDVYECAMGEVFDVAALLYQQGNGN